MNRDKNVSMNATQERILLSFDEQNPCWTTAALTLFGNDIRSVNALVNDGILLKKDDVYYLSELGLSQFEAVVEEAYLPLRPGVVKGVDIKQEALRVQLQLLLDKRHLQRWGLKEYCKPFRFEVPALKREELYELREEKPTWFYPDNSFYTSLLRDFPITGLEARKHPAPTAPIVTGWLDENMPQRKILEADLLYKSRYDFQAYAHFPPLPIDPCRLLDADRFLFFFTPPPTPENLNAFLSLLGDYHLFLTMLRRLYLPGYVDLDSLDQDGINWILFTYEKEEDALLCERFLKPYSPYLAGDAAPFEIWTLSLQALLEHNEVGESIHDLLPVVARPILRL